MHSHTASSSADTSTPRAPSAAASTQAPRRISSAALLQDGREIEIEHAGKVYRLRVTQLNKLILTA
ncbi:hemin uptake protein HemP [Janthinobacterium sp.]|uniref:hemin uptake protein HemP n=1 Tax=Janthinobacterium sp. TaxID=1871054 RepID=UPI00293D61F2|nr:hemin uptake protein HemP [Janthinobacterium sp.]